MVHCTSTDWSTFTGPTKTYRSRNSHFHSHFADKLSKIHMKWQLKGVKVIRVPQSLRYPVPQSLVISVSLSHMMLVFWVSPAPSQDTSISSNLGILLDNANRMFSLCALEKYPLPVYRRFNQEQLFRYGLKQKKMKFCINTSTKFKNFQIDSKIPLTKSNQIYG